jgi:hypothetical protein
MLSASPATLVRTLPAMLGVFRNLESNRAEYLRGLDDLICQSRVANDWSRMKTSASASVAVTERLVQEEVQSTYSPLKVNSVSTTTAPFSLRWSL